MERSTCPTKRIQTSFSDCESSNMQFFYWRRFTRCNCHNKFSFKNKYWICAINNCSTQNSGILYALHKKQLNCSWNVSKFLYGFCSNGIYPLGVWWRAGWIIYLSGRNFSTWEAICKWGYFKFISVVQLLYWYNKQLFPKWGLECIWQIPGREFVWICLAKYFSWCTDMWRRSRYRNGKSPRLPI